MLQTNIFSVEKEKQKIVTFGLEKIEEVQNCSFVLI